MNMLELIVRSNILLSVGPIICTIYALVGSILMHKLRITKNYLHKYKLKLNKIKLNSTTKKTDNMRLNIQSITTMKTIWPYLKYHRAS